MGLLLNKEIDSELRQGKSSYNKTVSFFCGSEGWFGEGGAAGLDDRWLGQVGKHINYSQGRQDSRRGRSGGEGGRKVLYLDLDLFSQNIDIY